MLTCPFHAGISSKIDQALCAYSVEYIMPTVQTFQGLSVYEGCWFQKTFHFDGILLAAMLQVYLYFSHV